MLPVAIDISDTLIRLVALEHRGRSWKLDVRAEIHVPEGVIKDGDVQQAEQLTELVRALVEAADIRVKGVTINLPERHTFVKIINQPEDGGQDLQQAVAGALSQHIPYSPDEVYWDWQRLTQTATQTQPQILIGASPRVTVDQYIDIFFQAGLRVDAAEIESIAIVRALFGPIPPDNARIVIDLGRTRSTLILVDHGIVQFSSTLRYAGRELNSFIADELRISPEQAERAKALFGLDPKRGKGVLQSVLTPHIDAIADAIAEVETFFQEHFPEHPPISKLHLTGSGALLRNIDIELQSRLQQTVVVEPSWIFSELFKVDPELPPELGFTYTTVFGLAARSWLTSPHD